MCASQRTTGLPTAGYRSSVSILTNICRFLQRGAEYSETYTLRVSLGSKLGVVQHYSVPTCPFGRATKVDHIGHNAALEMMLQTSH